MEQPDRFAIICNIAQPTKTAVAGAKAYLGITSGGAMGDGRFNLYIRSRGGRHIEKWEPLKRLSNFRLITLPFGHPFYNHRQVMWFETKEAAERELKFILAKPQQIV